jgi:hypothetical protein
VVVGSIAPEFEYCKQFTMRSVSQSFLKYLENSALIVEVWGKQGSGRIFHSSTLRAPDPSDEMAMDKVLAEADWREERKQLRQHIRDLQAEIDMLRIEKDTFEKEVTRVTLKSATTFMARSQSGGQEGLGNSLGKGSSSSSSVVALFNRFVSFDSMLRAQVETLSEAQVRLCAPELGSCHVTR